MGITGMMYTGLSGLTSTGRSIGVTSDNIANLNTIGYRGSRTIFEDVLNRSILGVGELGGGTRVGQIEKLFHQGPIVQSSKPEDIAISGRGFFILDGNHNGVEGRYYSRAGNFTLDNQGHLSSNGGLRVQGYPITNGSTGSTLSDLRLDRSIAPRVSAELNMEVNFDGFPLGATPIVPFDPANPGETASFTQDTIIYDSRGTPREVTMYFTRNAQDTWEWNLMADSAEVVGGTANPLTVIANGTLAFDTEGDLTTQTTTLDTMSFVDAAPNQQLVFDFTGSTNTSLRRSATANDNSTVNSMSQDGYQAGNYIGMQVSEDGTIVGKYDNGQQITVGRLALADFANETGLARVGGTFFIPSPDSGDAVVGFAGTGGKGTLQGNALEQSNVDLSEEFVKLITDQRGYQAQSRTITTADELLSETVNLKR